MYCVFFSSRRWHTRCALVTGVQTGALPISSPPPFPLLHVDTTWKFQAMYELRDRAAADAGMELLVHHNPEAMEKGINPFDHGSLHTDMWKTEGLKQALDKYGFDAAFGGARRDEEKSRAKE